MLSHALPMRELQRQELLAVAASERRLEQRVPAVVSETRDLRHRFADLQKGVVTTLAALRPARQLLSQDTTN